jgi:YfiH family protein
MWFIEDNLVYCKIFSDYGIKNFITTKKLSDMTHTANRDKILESFGIKPNFLVTAEQIHSSKVYHVKKENLGEKISRVDGLVTDIKGIPLGILTADCVPVFMVDKNKKRIGLIHCGRKGLEEGIIENGVDIFENPQDIEVALGPHICPKCYPINLSGEILRRLKSKGVKEKNIYSIDLEKFCTFHNPESFFSYRRGDKISRMISVIQM